MKLFGFGNSVKTQIGEIKDFVTKVKTMDVEKTDYKAIRSEFNVKVAGVLIGAKLETNKKGEYETSGWNSLPNKNQTAEIMLIVADFIDNVEPKFICGNAGIDEDMAIISPLGRNISDMEKVNGTDFKKMLFENIEKSLSKEDFQMLSLLAERLRKYNYKVAGLWAVGVTVVVAAGVGVYMYNKKQDEKKLKDSESEKYDDIGSDVIISIEDDAPPVIVLEEDAPPVIVLD